MAGTQSRRPAKSTVRKTDGPAVVLVEPQLGENIGMVARAMLNAGLTDLRLVRPRDGWPNDTANKTASGASLVLETARVFATTAEAVGDVQVLYATTARPRDMNKDEVTPRFAAAQMRTHHQKGLKTAVLFGRESKGLHNDDVALADALMIVPLNPAFSSLNLAQAVLLIGYEWFQAATQKPDIERAIRTDTRPATRDEMVGMFGQLEDALDDSGFLRLKAKRATMVRNLRNIFVRAGLTEQEVRTLRGVISSLTRR
ncbi:tRNA/rRNA methyltransferase [Varunaivibrio sulfuroxidans]|uniref:tRNA (cytidine/uridine-2'-O-)-methyltransferase TrmJ n=2 Tax=Varunaivibrio sulfuroxidans TaxID=1773489 RepID=A0A4R3J456_9PROT|nr:tRNA/rRNA methyltransferase [Varunaivibrio sulfuroxidans]WES32221.1 RNA methyltransferase [Varunaivibrio sulfuroxidans]